MRRRPARAAVLWSLVSFALTVSASAGQSPRVGRLLVTVADQTGAVIPGATVTVTLDETVSPPPAAPGANVSAPTSPQGVATIPGLTPGRYRVQVEFPGFQTASVNDVRVRGGDNRQRVVLALERVEDRIDVAQDPATAASDRRGPTFGTVLTREQIDALSDDPDELKRQLEELAGPGAVIRVDSFEGAALPHKSQIRMIRISRDQFAAENHSAGGLLIDIVTQPGLGPIRGTFNTRVRDGSMTGRSPLVDKKGPERTQNYGFGLSGTIAPNKTSFNLSVSGITSFDTPTINVALPSGTRSETLSLRRPRDQISVSAGLDHAITVDQTLRFNFNRSTNASRNQGIGNYDLPERAYHTDGVNYNVRAQHVGPLGRRFFTSTRLQVNWSDNQTRSDLEAPTIRVLDAFTSGGQQLAGGTRTRQVNLASDLDYVRGIHSVRTGIVLDSSWYHSDSTANYLGTYTFETLDAFEANRPRSYTRRIGDPTIDYPNLQAGLYLQDDIRVRQNLTLSPGVRYELQTHASDVDNLGPRVGVTWAPGQGGRTTLRASAGVFYDWLSTGTYEQTLRVDGFRQRELNIANPAFIDPNLPPGEAGTVSAVNRYLLGDVALARQVRFSGGIDRGLTRTARVGVTWAHMRGSGLRRGENLNAPVAGVRPDPAFANVIRVVSDARSRQDTVTVFFNASLARPTPAPAGGGAAPPLILAGLPQARTAPLFDWRRASISGQYGFNRLRNNTDGDFWVAPTGDLDAEWGVAGGDIRHRVNVSFSSQFLRNLTTSWNLNLSSGPPYTLQTGSDDNGDLIFNDRPAAVARNTERTPARGSLSANISYTFTFGKPLAGAPALTGVVITSTGGAVTAQTIAAPQTGRFRVTVFAQLQNLTNRANYVGYTGVLTSPLFGLPRDVADPRRIDFGMNFGF